MLFRLELKRSGPIFALALFVMAIPRLLLVATDADAFSVIYGLTSLITWSMVVAYVCFRLFSYYCLGSDLLLHITSRTRYEVLTAKALVLAVLTCGLSIASMLMDWSFYSPSSGALTWLDGAWMTSGRLLGVVSFVALSLSVIGAVKFARGKILMIILYVSSLALGVLLSGYVSWSIADVRGSEFFIGVSDQYENLAGLATIVPFFALGEERFVTSLAIASMIVNIGVLLVASLVWTVLGRRQSSDFYRI